MYMYLYVYLYLFCLYVCSISIMFIYREVLFELHLLIVLACPMQFVQVCFIVLNNLWVHCVCLVISPHPIQRQESPINSASLAKFLSKLLESSPQI